MTEYEVLPGPDDGTPIDERKHYVREVGSAAHHMRKSKRSAQWVASRMSKGLYVPDEDKMTPDEIRSMEEDQPE